MYLAAPGGGLWRTDNGGASWNPQIESAPSLQVCSVTVDPQFPDVVYLGTGDDQSPRASQGIARSADGGRNWTFEPRFTNQPVCALAVDSTNSARVFAGSAEGLFLSRDSGASWSKVLSAPVTSVAMDGHGGVYAGILGEHVLARSPDGGSTWTNLILPLNGATTTALRTNWVSVVASAGAVSVIVSSAQSPLSQLDFYHSTDAGTTWSAIYQLGQARPPVGLLADPSTQTLYVAGATLLISGNDGLTWQTIPTTTTEFHTVVSTGGMLLLAGEKGLELAAIRGTVTRTVSQLPIAQFLKAGLDSSNRVWAAGPRGLFGPFTGSTSAESSVAGIGPVGNVAVATVGSSNIIAAGNSRVYSSSDGGAHFSTRSVIADGELRAPYPPLVLDSVNTSSAYVAGARVYHTSNDGGSWSPLAVVDPDPTHVVIALAIPPASRTLLYAATACLPEVAMVSCPATSFVWRSPNGGNSWVQTGIVQGLINRLAVDPRQTNTIYAAIGAFPAGPSISAGLAAGDLLQSTNAGITWGSVRGNLPKVPVNTIAIDPASVPFQFNQPAQTLYAGTDAGVFISFNAGLQWTDLSGSVVKSLPASPITDLALVPGGGLVAATFGRGIYSLATTAELAPSVLVNPLALDVTLRQETAVTTGIALTNVSITGATSWRLNGLDSWITIPQTDGTLPPLASAQVPIRVSGAGLQPGTYLTRLQFVSGRFAQNILIQAHIQAHVTSTPANMTIINGNNAAGPPGSTLPPLQVLVSDAKQLPLPGVTVTFAITSGGGSLSARTVQTNAAGVASATLTLPTNTGPIKVTVTSGNLSATFNLTAVTAPSLQADSVFDGVTLNAYTSLGPGSIVSIFGRNLAEAIAVADNALLPTVLQSTRVVIMTVTGDVPLPLISVSPTQVRAMIPVDIAPGTYNLRVQVGLGRSNDVQISAAAFDPGIFTVNGSGRGPGIFVKDDGSIVSAANPADRGANVTFYAAGLGAVIPPVAAGQAGATREPLNRTLRTPRVLFDTYPAQVIYSGLAPGLAGRYQVTVRVPALVSPATNVSVSLTIGGFASNRVTIPVR